jgi:hypothetical protein
MIDDSDGKKPSAEGGRFDIDRFTPVDDILQIEGREILPAAAPRTLSKAQQANSILEDHERWRQIEHRLWERLQLELRPLVERIEMQEGISRRLRQAFIRWFDATKEAIDFSTATLPQKVMRVLFFVRELRRQMAEFIKATGKTNVGDDPRRRT